MSDEFILLSAAVPLSANAAETLPAKFADSENPSARNSHLDKPQIASALTADSASAYIRIEPTIEPRSEPSRADPADGLSGLDAIIETGGPLGEYARQMKLRLLAEAQRHSDSGR